MVMFPDFMKYISNTRGCFLVVTCAIGGLLVYKVWTRLMWSLSIIGCLYFEGYMARLVVKDKHQKTSVLIRLNYVLEPSIIYS